MGTAIKHPVPDRVKPSFVIFDIRAVWMDGWLGFNGILSTQVAAISCLRKFKVC